jgi:hypothetical protein
MVVIACLLSFMSPDVANSAKPVSKVLPPGGNTIAGPGSFNLLPNESEVVFISRFNQTQSPQICVTLVVTSPDVVVKLNVTDIPSFPVSGTASRALCFDFNATIEVRCEADNLTDCTGFWRVDRLP